MSFFDDLHLNVARMGKPERPPEIDTTMPPRTEPDFVRRLGGGIAIQLKDLEDSAAFGGLLGYRGAQVLLYIREKGDQIEEIRDKPFIGPKYHVANCQTLRRMRAENRFGRYVVTNDVTGEFLLIDSEAHRTREVRARLNVCKNCLDFLNYQDYRTDTTRRTAIFERFSLPTLFATYSTLFEFLPTGVTMWKSGDPRSWASRPKDAPEFERCESCDVRLPGSSSLIGVPAGPSGESGRVVCADCRRKPPISETVHVNARDMKRIARERPKNENAISWEEAYRLADCAFEGLMKLYERQGYEAPEPGFEFEDEAGAVCGQLGLAWPVSRHAVVLHESEAEAARRHGWEAFALEAALLDAREDG